MNSTEKQARIAELKRTISMCNTQLKRTSGKRFMKLQDIWEAAAAELRTLEN